MEKYSVGILLFPGVEVLDFAGPFEVFSRTRLQPGVDSRRSNESAPFDVFTVAKTPELLTATGGLKVEPDFDFESAPEIHLLVIPGGFGTRALLNDPLTLDWVKTRAGQARQVCSVCTGALVLARAGLLKGRQATTHWAAYDLLEGMLEPGQVQRDRRFVVDGVITSAGVAAGIDMAFHVVAMLYGREVAEETAKYIEYPLAFHPSSPC